MSSEWIGCAWCFGVPDITSFQQLRAQRHPQWLAELKTRIHTLLEAEPLGDSPRPDQIYLFGSRARGDWDAYRTQTYSWWPKPPAQPSTGSIGFWSKALLRM
jgi:hypothetical protein